MKRFLTAISAMALLPVCLFAQETGDTLTNWWEREMELNEVVVLGRRTVLKQSSDRIIYLTRNDIYAKGLNGLEVLDRMPRVSVVNDLVTVAGRSSVRYIVDGRLLEMTDEAIKLLLKNLQASGIEKIELLTTPPAKYATSTNVAFISITTRNEALGTRGSLWGRGVVKEDFSEQLGGNISHATRRVELSADAGWTDTRGINDVDRTYTFADHIKTSSRRTEFTNRQYGMNGLLKYKFSDRLCAGAMVNASGIRLKSRLTDVTTDGGTCFNSTNHSPSRPDDALTLTAFSDWQPDSCGKMFSLTYNYFDKRTERFADVTTTGNGTGERLTNDALGKYRIHSIKLDAVLPFNGFKIEAGLAFTAIGNNTSLVVNRHVDNSWVNDPSQSNGFDYDENTAAAYISMEKNMTGSIFGKVGLRYEHTREKSLKSENENNFISTFNLYNYSPSNYGYLFPTINISWDTGKAGRLSLSYAMGITRPDFADLNPFRYYTTTGDYVAGNPDLRPSLAHDAEINYSFKDVYAVLYHSFNTGAIGHVTRFNADGSQQTIPENCMDNSKTGLFVSFNRTFFGWWSMNMGGEVFHTCAKSKIDDFKDQDDNSWSGKLEMNNTWMLNHTKTLIFSLRLSHYFPYHERMTRFGQMTLVGCDIRYMLPGDRLTLSASVNDPFGWNITKSTAIYNAYSVFSRNNIHSHAVSFRLAYTFGRNKVRSVYRDSKERESKRAY